jgi:hypothetical protein
MSYERITSHDLFVQPKILTRGSSYEKGVWLLNIKTSFYCISITFCAHSFIGSYIPEKESSSTVYILEISSARWCLEFGLVQISSMKRGGSVVEQISSMMMFGVRFGLVAVGWSTGHHGWVVHLWNKWPKRLHNSNSLKSR